MKQQNPATVPGFVVLPHTFTYTKTMGKLSNFYTFNGEKLRKTYENSGTVTKVDYCGPFVYQTTSGVRSLNYIITAEGRAVANGGSWEYEYNITDHLGNVRTVIKPGTGGLATVVQEKHYYPFGLEMGYLGGGASTNKYLYNSKELNNDFEMYFYDYGARFYDPAIGRWSTPDPMAEFGRRWSPYTYGFDNPTRFVDPDGMWPYEMPGDKDKDKNRPLSPREYRPDSDIFDHGGGSPLDRYQGLGKDGYGEESGLKFQPNFIAGDANKKSEKQKKDEKSEITKSTKDVVAAGFGVELSAFIYSLNVGWYTSGQTGGLALSFASGPSNNLSWNIYGSLVQGDKNFFKVSDLGGQGYLWSGGYGMAYSRGSNNFADPNYITNQVSLGLGKYKLNGSVSQTKTVVIPTTPFIMLNPLLYNMHR